MKLRDDSDTASRPATMDAGPCGFGARRAAGALPESLKPLTRHAVHVRVSLLWEAVPYPIVISIALALAGPALGNSIFSTPLRYVAFALFAITGAGRGTTRWKVP